MMKKFMMALVMVLGLGIATPAMAVHAPDGAGHSLAIKVNGLVCDFCAQAITTLLKKQAGVKDVGISLEKGLVTIDMEDGTTMSDELIDKIMTDSGYTVVEINRTDG